MAYRWIVFLLVFLLFEVGVRADDTKSAQTPAERISARSFPSVFQAWNAADNFKDEDRWTSLARHDLVFHAPDFFGLKWNGKFNGLSTSFIKESQESATTLKNDLLKRNSNLILLAELRYRDAHNSHLPGNHEWWKRKDGKIVPGWEEGGYLQLDFSNPAYRGHVARQAKAIMDTGIFDGIMLDWWEDDNDRLALVKDIRKQIGGNALILVNANDRRTPKTAAFVNGYFMECYKSKTPEDWNQIANTLEWAENNLREPRINCLETWFHKSRNDLHLMRATTTLSLTLSNGYCLFSDPNPLPTPDHLHDWYKFWDKSLGRPKSKGQRKADGSIQREFDSGIVVYNPAGNQTITVEFTMPLTSTSTRTTGKTFQVQSGDGDLFLIKAKK
jgi:hypothetical protein